MGCEVDGYVSDVGRTFPAGGRFSDIQREKLEVSNRATAAIIAAVRPGVTLRQLTQVAYDAIPDHEEPYMQTASFFGHHIGLSVGEVVVLVTDDGAEVLTAALPRDPGALEALLR